MMFCLTCKFKLGVASQMEEVGAGLFLCRLCKTTKATTYAAPVLMARSGITRILFLGSFMLLLLATVVFDAFPALQISLTWAMLYSMYLVYFGLAFVNFKRRLYV